MNVEQEPVDDNVEWTIIFRYAAGEDTQHVIAVGTRGAQLTVERLRAAGCRMLSAYRTEMPSKV